MKKATLSEVRSDLARLLRQAATQQIVITRRGRPAGVLIGFASDDEWHDFQVENDPRFLERIAAGRASLRTGQGIRLEDLDEMRPRSSR